MHLYFFFETEKNRNKGQNASIFFFETEKNRNKGQNASTIEVIRFLVHDSEIKLA